MKLRSIALLICTLLMVAAPAHADQHTFIGTAEATALKLTITPPGDSPQGLTFGASGATVQSDTSEDCDGTACASGAAAVEPFGETAQVTVTQRADSASAEGFVVPEPLEPILSGALGIATAQATPSPAPTADGTATAGELQINLVNSLLEPLREDLEGGVNELVDGLAPLLDPLQENDPSGLTEQVETLIRDLVPALADQPLTTVRIGASTSHADDSAEGSEGITTARATAQGAVIELAPVPTVAADGLFRVVVGEATALAQTDQTTATTSSKGSIVRLFVADLTTPEPDDYQEVDIATDQPETCVGESPLLLCIIAGGTADEVDGADATAVAAAVRIQAFADADAPDADNPLPGITLAVAEAIAGVSAAGPTAVSPDDEPTLPSTGGGMALIGFVVLGAGAATAGRLRRR
jgi:hypothetical protein